MKYFLIAGEASGDIHGADLIRAILRDDPEGQVRFLGGDLMAEAAGVAPEIHYRSMAYMGFVDVIRHLPDVGRNLSAAKSVIAEFNPDAVVLIDYPGFNMRIARYCRERGLKVYYYISPKVWAWKEYRVKAMKRDIDCIFSILPFEEAFFEKHGMKVEYVGNPSVVEVDERLALATPSPVDGRYIALVPGSRVGEIRSNLPVMAAVAARHPEFKAVIAGAPSIPLELYREICDLEVVQDATFELMRHAEAALVTSGTATLECALTGTPQVACYRNNGSRLVYDIMSKWLKVKYVTLPNLICDAPVIPEMLLHHCNVDEVDAKLSPLLRDGTPERDAQQSGYRAMRTILGTRNPAVTAASRITARP